MNNIFYIHVKHLPYLCTERQYKAATGLNKEQVERLFIVRVCIQAFISRKCQNCVDFPVVFISKHIDHLVLFLCVWNSICN